MHSLENLADLVHLGLSQGLESRIDGGLGRARAVLELLASPLQATLEADFRRSAAEASAVELLEQQGFALELPVGLDQPPEDLVASRKAWQLRRFGTEVGHLDLLRGPRALDISLDRGT